MFSYVLLFATILEGLGDVLKGLGVVLGGFVRRCLGGRFGQDFDVMERLREVLGLAWVMYKKLCGTHQMRLLPILA